MKRLDIAGQLQLLRPYVRPLVPQRLHHLAGHAGRWMVSTLERHAPRVAVCPPVAFPAVPDRQADMHRDAIVLVNASLAAGGAERQVVNLLRGLAASGRHVRLLTLHLDERPELRHFLRDLDGCGVEVRNAQPAHLAIQTLVADCGRRAVDAFLASLEWAPADIHYDIMRLAAELLPIRPAVVHGWQDATGIVAAFAALAIGTPRIIVGGRNLHPDHFSHARPYMRVALQYLAGCPQVVLTNNSEAGARSYAEWLGIDVSQIKIVRNGLDLCEFVRPAPEILAALRSSLGIPLGARVVGGAFRLQAEKRPLLWVDVAGHVSRQAPDIYFVVFGEGTMREQMRKRAARLGLGGRLVLPGRVEDVRSAIAMFNAMLLTSSHEGTPNVVLEAACLGVPVVATDAGGTAETIVEGTTGIVVRQGLRAERVLEENLAKAISSVLVEGPSCETVVREGHALIRAKFGQARMVEEMLGIYA